MLSSPPAAKGAAIEEQPIRSVRLMLAADQVQDRALVAGQPDERDWLVGDDVVEGIVFTPSPAERQPAPPC